MLHCVTLCYAVLRCVTLCYTVLQLHGIVLQAPYSYMALCYKRPVLVHYIIVVKSCRDIVLQAPGTGTLYYRG